MEIIYIVIAFVFGFAVKQAGLPPLVGFLVAGFILNYLDIEATDVLLELSDVGIIRILEDLIDLLIRKNVILFTELPLEAQAKISERKKVRERIAPGDIMVDDIL